ncbi:hypothetical protein SFC55_07760 [Niallia taxi]|uniref:hypothetical protein n=1 Tax=Niallia taxi TaxID=2499688 RepID=UPI003982B980
MDINWYILCAAILSGAAGCTLVLWKKFQYYKTTLLIHAVLSILLCLFFYFNGFYRYALPVSYILPAVVINFGLFITFLIRFEPKEDTFRFYFVLITWTFSLEIVLEYFGFIRFRNGWDFWDSYSLYWIYARIFSHIGKRLVPMDGRTPVNISNRGFRTLYYMTIFFFFIGLLILLRTAA